MVGNIVRREVAEPIYREMLRDLDDERLEAAAKSWIWQREVALYGPAEEDEWHCDSVREECARRGRLEIFLRAENNILAQVRKIAGWQAKAPQRSSLKAVTLKRQPKACEIPPGLLGTWRRREAAGSVSCWLLVSFLPDALDVATFSFQVPTWLSAAWVVLPKKQHRH